MSGKVRFNVVMFVLILFIMIIGISCNTGGENSAESKSKKSVLVVFNMSPGTVVQKGNKKTCGGWEGNWMG